MRQRISTLIATLLATMLLSALATAASVQTDYDTAQDFSQLRSYQWAPQTDNIDTTFALLTDASIKDTFSWSIERTLTLASNNPPDVLIRYYIKNMKKLVDDRPRLGIGMGGFGDNVGGGVSFSIPLGGNDLDQNAQVVIDIIDPKTQKLLWRGSVATGMSSTSNQTNQKQLQKAADDIFKQFPPRN